MNSCSLGRPMAHVLPRLDSLQLLKLLVSSDESSFRRGPTGGRQSIQRAGFTRNSEKLSGPNRIPIEQRDEVPTIMDGGKANPELVAQVMVKLDPALATDSPRCRKYDRAAITSGGDVTRDIVIEIGATACLHGGYEEEWGTVK